MGVVARLIVQVFVVSFDLICSLAVVFVLFLDGHACFVLILYPKHFLLSSISNPFIVNAFSMG